MRALVRRVKAAKVSVAGEGVGAIDAGLMILVGVGQGDTPEQAELLAKKAAGLRIFADEAGKMNASVLDVGGSCLVVSQFTLYADCRKGRRPSFMGAQQPEVANELCERFCELLRQQGAKVETGRFAADMLVDIANDGPVTILLDTDDLQRSRRSGS